jgi:hypothetical protein
MGYFELLAETGALFPHPNLLIRRMLLVPLQMEQQLFIAEAFGLLDDGRTQDLFDRDPFCPAASIPDAVGKVLQNHVCYGKNTIGNPAYPVQIFGPGMLDVARHKGLLSLIFLAHFSVTPFFAFFVKVSGCCLSWMHTSEKTGVK